MKLKIKIFPFFITPLVLLFSCSKEDVQNENIKTVKKITESLYENGVATDETTTNFLYKDNKLIGAESIDFESTTKIEFIYSGDKMVSVVFKDVSGKTLHSNNISYDGINIKSVMQNNEEEKADFIYSDGKIISNSFYRSSPSSEWILNETETMLFDSFKNVVEKQTWNKYSNSVNIRKYDYDTKNNPMKNMISYFRYTGIESADFVSTNNIIKTYYFDEATQQSVLNSEYEIKYDSDDFPVEIKKYWMNNNQRELVSIATFEYN
jgi:hypothetical protein